MFPYSSSKFKWTFHFPFRAIAAFSFITSFVQLHTTSSRNIYSISNFMLSLSLSLFCSPSVFVLLKCSHPLSDSFYHPKYTSFNHSGIFIYSNYIPKCNWFPVPFIYSELEISLKYRFYDTFPPPCYIS